MANKATDFSLKTNDCSSDNLGFVYITDAADRVANYGDRCPSRFRPAELKQA